MPASHAGLRCQLWCLSKLTLQEEAYRALGLRRIAFDDRAGQRAPEMNRVIEMSCAGLIAIALNVGAVAQVCQDRPSIDPLQALNASLAQLTAKVYPAIVHIRVASYGSSAQYGSEEKSQSLTRACFKNRFGLTSGTYV